MRCPTLLALLAGVMLYLVIGALVFRTLESPKESKEHEKLLHTTRDFLQNHSCVTAQNLSDLIKSVVKAVEAGLDVKHSSTNFTSRWDLASAFFFCGTIITTIGFGNLSPRTKWGQLFCVCYALVGIPMFGFLLAGVGDHMGTGLRKAVWKMETLFLKQRVSPTYVRVMSAVLSILIGCLIFLAVPTLVFKEVEDWSFLEALYFVVITLTTVGFGDYVAGSNRKDGDLFKPLVWLWIVFGLAYFASILTMIGNWLRVLSKKTRAEMEELRAHATDWTQNIQNMSMDFRIPNPLDLNDPFLLQRRRWKRSTRRRVRRGALGHRGRQGVIGENGHLPNRWVTHTSSMTRLEVVRLGGGEVRTEGARLGPGVGLGVGLRPDCRVSARSEGRSLGRTVARSLSMPAARSMMELDYDPDPIATMMMPWESGSVSESPESDSRSVVSSSDSHTSEVCTAGQGIPFASFDPSGGLCTEQRGRQGVSRLVYFTEDVRFPVPLQQLPKSPNSTKPIPMSPISSVTPLPPPPGCKMLDFFGENLAYIDESSDALSDRNQPVEGGVSPLPRIHRMRRQLPHRSPLRERRDSDLQPPSNPPTPPPLSHLRD
ncbi:potassium channel subfamily K member 4 isoform X1 [Coregonus clupeaformis]|uniref:potassium channel subfamily K member 4 isoform X1 n=1 Tax=Coregonus clupeaformis TaxID=59861 RepID=UPI001E1C4254|nr:potassium channel subfamily K member 4 isoform X1 [Coregonus clupeaformis]XP_041704596.2 potassium channel subfamily K member 4 isoform X1 [Coregonus clupeaformis]